MLCIPKKTTYILLSLVFSAGAAKISSTFSDTTYRIERQYVPNIIAKTLLQRLVQEGVPTERDSESDKFYPDNVKVLGNNGLDTVEQLSVENYTVALQKFGTEDYHALTQERSHDTSVVYYIEQLEGAPRERSEKIIQEVAPNSILEDGGTIHLYLSSPGAAALGNHTDTTPIVVLQLDGEKEWFLCKDPLAVDEGHGGAPQNEMLRKADKASLFSKKLDSCSTYSEFDIDSMECQREILRPGDALFLPRRTVHSARALDRFSAHLTFGYNEDSVCHDYVASSRRYLSGTLGGRAVCGCDTSCDSWCNGSCDRFRVFSCDSRCKSSCDQSCDDPNFPGCPLSPSPSPVCNPLTDLC